MWSLKFRATSLTHFLQQVPEESIFLQTLRNILHFTIPSFLLDETAAKPASSRPLNSRIAAQRASTDCLDGLRGVAAFIVMMFHYTQYAYPRLREVYGFEGRYHLTQLPFIKLLFSGGFMVFLFFVISGYVLSARIVRLMVQEQRGSILKVLSSMTFRRVVRLGLPSFVASFIGYIFHRAGWRFKPYPEHQASFTNDTVFYYRSLRNWFTFYDWNAYRIWYLEPLWSIAVEFRYSMMLFLILLGLSQCRRTPHLIVECLIIVDNVIHDRWDMACFMFGLVIAELYIHSQEISKLDLDEDEDENKEQLPHYSDPNSREINYGNLGLWIALLVGLYLGSVPTEGTCQTPGYITLCSLTSKYSEPWRYIALPGSFLLIFALVFLPSLQKPLSSPLARYLGRLGYAVYLVHELVNMMVGHRIREMGWMVMGNGEWGYHLGFGLGLCVFVGVCVWLADMFMRAVDVPAVGFARWVEEKCKI